MAVVQAIFPELNDGMGSIEPTRMDSMDKFLSTDYLNMHLDRHSCGSSPATPRTKVVLQSRQFSASTAGFPGTGYNAIPEVCGFCAWLPHVE